MWFEQMHEAWQLQLASWREWLASMETKLKPEANLAPEFAKVMAAFLTDPNEIRVVVMGQDPYPTAGMAVGRAFAVANETAKLPASLKNIFKELESDLGAGDWFNQPQPAPDLQGWQEQGVLLLNRHLTTLHGHPEAHAGLGWSDFTLAAVQALVNRPNRALVLLLWGSHAQKIVTELTGIDAPNVRVVQGVHPSPLSAYRGFFGSRPFSAVNGELENLGEPEVDWFR